MRRLAAVVLAATVTIGTAVGCTDSPESQAGRDPSAPPPSNSDDTLPLAPDVDPCRLPPNVVGLLAGLVTDPGVFTSTGDAEGECLYGDRDGNGLVVTVDTSGGSSSYDEADRTTGGEEISSVGDEAFWSDPTLHVLSDGHHWTFTLTTPGTDANRRQTVTIALAQALEL